MSHVYGGISFEQIRRMGLEEYLARVSFANAMLRGGQPVAKQPSLDEG